MSLKKVTAVGGVLALMTACSAAPAEPMPASDETYHAELFGEPMRSLDGPPEQTWTTDMGGQADVIALDQERVVLWNSDKLEVWNSKTGEQEYSVDPSDLSGTGIQDVTYWEPAHILGVTVFDASHLSTTIVGLNDQTWDQDFTHSGDGLFAVSNEGQCFVMTPGTLNVTTVSALESCESDTIGWQTEVTVQSLVEPELRFVEKDGLLFIGEADVAGDMTFVDPATGERRFSSPLESMTMASVFPVSDRIYVIENTQPDYTLSAYTYSGEQIATQKMAQYIEPIVLGDDFYMELGVDPGSKVVKIDRDTLKPAWPTAVELSSRGYVADPTGYGRSFASFGPVATRMPFGLVFVGVKRLDLDIADGSITVVDPSTREITSRWSIPNGPLTPTTQFVAGHDQVIGIDDEPGGYSVSMWAYDVVSGEQAWQTTLPDRATTSVWNVLSAPASGQYFGYW